MIVPSVRVCLNSALGSGPWVPQCMLRPPGPQHWEGPHLALSSLPPLFPQTGAAGNS